MPGAKKAMVNGTAKQTAPPGATLRELAADRVLAGIAAVKAQAMANRAARSAVSVTKIAAATVRHAVAAAIIRVMRSGAVTTAATSIDIHVRLAHPGFSASCST